MMRSAWVWPIIIIVSAIATGFVVAGEVAPPLRPAVVLWFLSLCPGMAFVRLLSIVERLPELILAIALSLALDSIVAGLMVYAGTWSPPLGLAILIVLSIGGALLQLRRSRTQPAGSDRARSAPR